MRNASSVISVLATRGRLGVAPPGVTTFYALGVQTTPTLYKSIDGGLTWTANTGIGNGAGGGRLAINSKGFMVDYRTTGAVFKSTNYGRTWDSMGSTNPPSTGTCRSAATWDPYNRRFIFTPFDTTSGGRRHYLTTAVPDDRPGNTINQYYSSSISGNSSIGYAPGMYVLGNTSSNDTPQIQYNKTTNGSSWNTGLNSGMPGVLGLSYSPKHNYIVGLAYGVATTNNKAVRLSPVNASYMSYGDTIQFQSPPGLFFWSKLLDCYVRTNDNYSNVHASSRYLYLSDDGFEWTTIDLGSAIGVQRGWAESNDELILFTSNNRIVRFTSPTAFSVINTGFSSYGGTCFVPE